MFWKEIGSAFSSLFIFPYKNRHFHQLYDIETIQSPNVFLIPYFRIVFIKHRFTCDQCGMCVEGKENYTRHYLQAHGILHCILCSYSFTTENISVKFLEKLNCLLSLKQNISLMITLLKQFLKLPSKLKLLESFYDFILLPYFCSSHNIISASTIFNPLTYPVLHLL